MLESNLGSNFFIIGLYLLACHSSYANDSLFQFIAGNLVEYMAGRFCITINKE